MNMRNQADTYVKQSGLSSKGVHGETAINLDGYSCENSFFNWH